MSDGSRSGRGKPFPARKTVYKGIEMRSRLEAGYAMWLDQRRWTWSYEPCVFGNEQQQYLPDFRIENVRDLNTGRTAHAYVDVKPGYDFDTAAFLRRMEVIWDSEPEALLLIQAPTDNESLARIRCLWRFQTKRPDGSTSEFRHEGWTSWMAGCPEMPGPTLGMPLPVAFNPWHGEWWKAATDMAPPA